MKTQWQLYKDLEQLPDTLSEPQTIHSPFMARLDQWLRSRLNHRAEKLDYENQVEYLERRLALRCAQSVKQPGFRQKLWAVLNQPLVIGGHSSTHLEPEIHQTLDPTGQKWWKVYDPMTGQTAYLESETDVQIWLEERLYH